jgi:hypothetical protein
MSKTQQQTWVVFEIQAKIAFLVPCFETELVKLFRHAYREGRQQIESGSLSLNGTLKRAHAVASNKILTPARRFNFQHLYGEADLQLLI